MNFYFDLVGISHATEEGSVMFKLVPVDSYTDLDLAELFEFVKTYKPAPKIVFQVTNHSRNRGEILLTTEPKMACLLLGDMESNFEKAGETVKNKKWYFADLIQFLNNSFSPQCFGYRD